MERSGLQEVVDSNVLIYIHKERELDDVELRWPAEHYMLVDDKLRILTAVKQVWGARVTTVLPRHGDYALDPKEMGADINIERIGELLECDLSSLLEAGRSSWEPGEVNPSTSRLDFWVTGGPRPD